MRPNLKSFQLILRFDLFILYYKVFSLRDYLAYHCRLVIADQISFLFLIILQMQSLSLSRLQAKADASLAEAQALLATSTARNVSVPCELSLIVTV